MLFTFDHWGHLGLFERLNDQKIKWEPALDLLRWTQRNKSKPALYSIGKQNGTLKRI